MNFSHHSRNPTHIVAFAQFTFFALDTVSNVILHRFFPEALIGSIDCKFGSFLRYLHIRVCQNKFTDRTAQGKTIYTIPRGQHHHC